MAEQPALVSIVRRPDGPTAVRIERTAVPDWAAAPRSASALVASGLPLRVVEAGAGDRAVAEVRRAWDSLADARITPSSVAALLLVLRRAVLDEAIPSGVVRFDRATAAAPFRPTAAHPRAYEGTSARPPKAPAPRRFDLRAVALDPRASRDFVERFASEVAAASDLLEEADGVAGWDGMALSHRFRTLVWPRLRWMPGRPTASVLSALRRPTPSLAVAAAWWLAEDVSEAAALAWLGAALALPDELAEVALFVCAEAGAADVPVGEVPLLEVAAANGQDRAGFAFELWTLLDGRRRGVDARLLLPGLELLRDGEGGRLKAGERPAELVPAEAIRALGRAHEWRRRWPRVGVALWRALSRSPGLAAVVLAQPWEAIDRDAAEELLGAIVWGWPEDDADTGAVADWWMEALSEIVELARDREPAYAAKTVDALAEAVSLFRRSDRLRALWPWLAPMVARLAAPPFRPEIRSFLVWNNLVDHPPAGVRDAVVAAPDRLWKELERRCRVPAQAELLSCGFDALGKAHGERLARSFLAGTPRLWEVAGLVGGMSDRSAERVCRAADDVADPVAWLERVRDVALADLGSGLDADVSQPRVRHALMLQRTLVSNRRALRKFLRSHMDGDADYVGRHPLTRRWLAAHPAVDPARWTTGIRLEATIDVIGDLTLRLETDPLEALRLGTYVGSCLSVRGVCDYSAAAVVLDVNKQVVYARNRRGSVIARQLLALSEEDALVAFDVYPLSAPAPVKRLFARYDRAFAAELGLPLWRPVGEDDESTIAEVISSAWWNDGGWLSGFTPSGGRAPDLSSSP
jgi:hypothetical protein